MTPMELQKLIGGSHVEVTVAADIIVVFKSILEFNF
jgi:hypothetical protein